MSLYSELKRRNVLRAGAAYVVVAWLLIQVAETIFPLFGFDDTPARIVVIVLAVGFIPAMVVAWAFELTPEGLKKERDADRAAVAASAYKNLDRLIMLGLALALGYFAFDRLVLAPQREAAVAEEARQEGRAEALVESYGDQSIAVLPFDDMSPAGDQAYFSEGMAEEILNVLAKVPELRVISRSSSFAFKDQALEIPEVARRLKVSHVLEGSVRKAGNTLRITAQLIEARSDTHLWSETWDRDLDDVFAVQDEIARAVVAALRSEILGEGTLQVQAPSNTRAYELVLRGRQLNNMHTAESYRRAGPFFEKAIEVDPEYAAAWGGLAKSLRQQCDFGVLDCEEVFPRIEQALNRALAFDPDNADALAIRGKMLRQPDVEAAREYWRRAISSNPSDPDAYRWMAWSYQDSDPPKFTELLQQSYRVDPTSPLINLQLGMALAVNGRFGEALALQADFHELDPSTDSAMEWAHILYTKIDQPERAARAFYSAYRLNPKTGAYNNFLAFLLESIGAPELARTWLEEWKQRLGPEYLRASTDLIQEAILLVREGQTERASEFLENAWKQGQESAQILAFFTLRAMGDFERARELFEIDFLNEGGTFTGFNPNGPWHVYIDYALALQHTGEPEAAQELLNTIRAQIRSLREVGAVLGPFLIDLNAILATLEAVDGNSEAALNSLQQATMDGFTCPSCLQIFPHFNNLRGKPEFEALITSQKARQADRRQRLLNTNLLLTPGEVLAMSDADFDPFEQGLE